MKKSATKIKYTAKASVPAYMLVEGPKNMLLMLEQSGVRYATLFLSQKAVERFQSECCSLNSYQAQKFESAAEILNQQQTAAEVLSISVFGVQKCRQLEVAMALSILDGRQEIRIPASKSSQEKFNWCPVTPTGQSRAA